MSESDEGSANPHTETEAERTKRLASIRSKLSENNKPWLVPDNGVHFAYWNKPKGEGKDFQVTIEFDPEALDVPPPGSGIGMPVVAVVVTSAGETEIRNLRLITNTAVSKYPAASHNQNDYGGLTPMYARCETTDRGSRGERDWSGMPNGTAKFERGDKTPLQELERLGIQLHKQKGTHQILACCPLPNHDDRTPSWGMSARAGVWHCYGCSSSGDFAQLLVAVGVASTTADAWQMVFPNEGRDAIPTKAPTPKQAPKPKPTPPAKLDHPIVGVSGGATASEVPKIANAVVVEALKNKDLKPIASASFSEGFAAWVPDWAKSKGLTAAALRKRNCCLAPSYRNSNGKRVWQPDNKAGWMLLWFSLGGGQQQRNNGRTTLPDTDTRYPNRGVAHGDGDTRRIVFVESVTTACAVDLSLEVGTPQGETVQVEASFGASSLPKIVDTVLGSLDEDQRVVVTVLADNDDAGLKAATKAVAVASNYKQVDELVVHYPTLRGDDFGDVWLEHGISETSKSSYAELLHKHCETVTDLEGVDLTKLQETAAEPEPTPAPEPEPEPNSDADATAEAIETLFGVKAETE